MRLMVDSRRKGQAAMNTVCKTFTQWLFPDTPTNTPVYSLPFRVRSTSIMPVEGHWDGKGDILHRPDIHFPFCTEVKKHEGWTLDALFRPKSPIWKWWEQCTNQADACSGIPLLIFMRNRIEPYVLLPFGAYHTLHPTTHGSMNLTLSHDSQKLTVCLLKDLIKADPEKLTELVA
jgi:hypothetical protein